MTLLRRKQLIVEGYLNDGTNAKAETMASWINHCGGKATPYLIGEHEFSQHSAVVKLENDVLTNLVVAGFWVINMGKHEFIAVPTSIIHLAYDLVDGAD